MAAETDAKVSMLRPSWLRARAAKWAGLAYALGLGFLLARKVMVLTTMGRVTGKKLRTPLWYVRDGDTVYCLSSWGSSSDWLKNLRANSEVTLQIGWRRWNTRAATQGMPEIGELLPRFQRKYGRRTVKLLYHLDRLVPVAFPLTNAP